jgi:hypothetical protein
MRLKSDEQRLLAQAKDSKLPMLRSPREWSIISKFTAFGLMTAGEKLTSQGLHIAALHRNETAENGTVYGQEESGLAGGSRPGDCGRDQSGSCNQDCGSDCGPATKAQDGPVSVVCGDAGNLPGTDCGIGPDAGAIPEETPISTGRDADCD